MEFGSLDPSLGLALLVVFELLLPARLPYDDALRRGLHPDEEIVAARHLARRLLAEAVEHVARLLKLD